MRSRRNTLTACVCLIATSPFAGAQLNPQFATHLSGGDLPSTWEYGELGQAVVAGDFDCDGFDDLAIGHAGFSFGIGQVLVVPGGPGEMSLAGAVPWSQSSAGVEGTPATSDSFGAAVASGDFNGDGCPDLAVGVPYDFLLGVEAGGVNVLYGGAGGLTGTDSQLLSQTALAEIEEQDRFGFSLAVGDFDDDGIDDLAVGSPGEDLDGHIDAGAVDVFFGTMDGICLIVEVCMKEPVRLQRGGLLQGAPQAFEELGSALAAGDFVLDLAGGPGDELAIGAPGREVAGQSQAGSVLVVSNVPTIAFDTEWSQETAGIANQAEQGDGFGSSLAAGDFDGRGTDELVVGVPDEDKNVGGFVGTVGAVHVFEFVFGNHQTWVQTDISLSELGNGDAFGFSLAAGDFDADGLEDLAIGAPGETLGTVFLTGIVHVVFGQQDVGLVADGAQVLTKAVVPIAISDLFGSSLAAGNLRSGAGADLAVGIPGEDVAPLESIGAVNVFYSGILFEDGFESGDVSAW